MGRASAYVLVGLPFVHRAGDHADQPGYMQPLYHTSTGQTLIMLGLGHDGGRLPRPQEDRLVQGVDRCSAPSPSCSWPSRRLLAAEVATLPSRERRTSVRRAADVRPLRGSTARGRTPPFKRARRRAVVAAAGPHRAATEPEDERRRGRAEAPGGRPGAEALPDDLPRRQGLASRARGLLVGAFFGVAGAGRPRAPASASCSPPALRAPGHGCSPSAPARARRRSARSCRTPRPARRRGRGRARASTARSRS